MSEPDYKQALIEQEHEIQQELGEALYGYHEGLPCWGDHVAVTLAIEAGRRIKQLTAALREIGGDMAEKVLAEYPVRSDDQTDARRYRAIRNHTQMMDPRMDGTSLYRVRGFSGRFRNFDEAADELIKREIAGTPRRRDPFAEDKP